MAKGNEAEADQVRDATIERWLAPGEQGANLRVEDFLSMRLANLGALLHRSVTRRYLKAYDVSLPEWRVLTMLVRTGPVTTRLLRDASEMDKGQVSRALLGLVERGLVERQADATHELRQVLHISPAGRALYAKIIPEARRGQAKLLAGLTAAEKKALASALVKLKALATAED